MTDSSTISLLRRRFFFRGGGLREEDFISANQYMREALSENKREGLLLAVRARWAALAIIALLIPYLNFTWAALYYEVLLVGFALIGWAQLRVGRVAKSRQELILIFCRLDLLGQEVARPVADTEVGRLVFRPDEKAVLVWHDAELERTEPLIPQKQMNKVGLDPRVL